MEDFWSLGSRFDRYRLIAEEMKQLIADDLRKRYVSNEIPMIFDCATSLDVRLKNTFVADSDAVKDRMHAQ